MSDFLQWDEDICLDEILGDYTDYDNLCPDSDEDFVQSVAPTTIKGTSIYVCPVCKKKLRTISGFRGHTTKQHNIHSLKGFFQYEEAALILSDYTHVVNVTLGQSFSFHCTGCRQDGIRLRRNREWILSISSCSNDLTFPDKYGIRCLYGFFPTREAMTLTIQIPAENMTEEEHNSDWICANNFGRYCYPLPCQYIRLYVQVPVKQISILYTRHNMTFVKEGQELTCMTSGIRPPATLSWYIDGQKVKNESLITYSTSGNDTELYTSYSSLRLWGNSSVETRTIYCEGINIPEQSPVQSEPVRIQTLFNPGEAPNIEGYYSGSRLLTTDQPLQLSCKIRKSWPNPSLHWICPSYSSSENISYTDGYMVSRIRVNIDLDLDGKVCTCVATHSVGNFQRHESVTFVVLGHQYIDSKTGVTTLAVGVISLIGALSLVVITAIRNKFSCRITFRKKDSDRTDGRNDVKMTSLYDGPRMDYEEVNSETKTGDSESALSTGHRPKKNKLEKYLDKPIQLKETSDKTEGSNDVAMAPISDEPREIYEELSSETKMEDTYTTLSMGKKPKQKKLEKCPEKPALLRETPGRIHQEEYENTSFS